MGAAKVLAVEFYMIFEILYETFLIKLPTRAVYRLEGWYSRLFPGNYSGFESQAAYAAKP